MARHGRESRRAGAERPVLGLLGLHDGGEVLGAALFVEHTEHGRAALSHPGDLVDRLLDVVRRVLLPADDDQILVARDEEQVTVGEVAAIAGVQASRRRGWRVASGSRL